VILVDTSVWIEHLRRTQSRAHLEFRDLAVTDPASIATCEPIAMELLAGPTDPFTVRRIEDQLGGLDGLTVDPAHDFRTAATLARAVRRNGHSVRSLDRPTRRELLDLVASREPVRSGPSSTELIDAARNAS
jgi:predicted nucleic acid-binding protein